MRETPLGFWGEGAAGARHFFGNGIVVGGRGHDGDIMKIFGGGADHRRTTDVDVLDQLFERHARLGCGFLEGVEIHDHHVDGSDAVLGHGGYVFRIIAAMQNAAMHFGMQRLDAAVEHFGEAGEFGNIFDCYAGVAEKFGGASGGDEFNAKSRELAREIDQSGLVGDTENGAPNLLSCRGHDGLRYGDQMDRQPKILPAE